jgi:SnoaL-like domain
MDKFSIRDEIVEVVNRLFIYTDMQDWDKLQKEVFTDCVEFDMSSLSGEKALKQAREICGIWKAGFAGIDSVNHLAGNYLIQIENQAATVFAYATATHFKEAATNGKTREFVGTYNIGLDKTASGWRINRFRYNLKYATGNLDLK